MYDVYPWLVQCRLALNQNGDMIGADIQSSEQQRLITVKSFQFPDSSETVGSEEHLPSRLMHDRNC